MKIVSFEMAGRRRVGVEDGEHVVDVTAALEPHREITEVERVLCEDMSSVIKLGARGRELLDLACQTGTARLRRDQVHIVAPIQPSLILCSGENYWDHRDEKPAVEGKEPEFFLKSPLGVIGYGDDIELDSRVTRKLDYETELLIIIGRKGRHIQPHEAMDYVFGFTIMNDVTARDRQVKLRPDGSSTYSLGPGKNFDTSAPIGPCIVTRDAIVDPQALDIKTWVNGELRQNNNTRQMIWKLSELVAFFSNYITLRPGVVISTGTPGGTGWGTDADLGGRGLKQGVSAKWNYLKGGDEVICEIEGIGRLRNQVRIVHWDDQPEQMAV